MTEMRIPVVKNIPRDKRTFWDCVEWVASWQALNTAADRGGKWQHSSLDIARYWAIGFFAAVLGYAKGYAMRCFKF